MFLLQANSADTPQEPHAVRSDEPGLQKPRLLHKVDPDYTESAKAAGAHGTVLLNIVVNEQGRPVDISVISPLGFGLDEKARQAIEQWRFAPGTKDGAPIPVAATIEVNFRIMSGRYDADAEQRRTEFNMALQSLRDPDPKRVEIAVGKLQELAKKKFPPAMYVYGSLLMQGRFAPKDTATGVSLIKAAAKKNHGPAMYELGKMYLDGNQEPKDPQQGMELISEASMLGSRNAQYFLGTRYEAGEGVPADAERARRYFRLCAARGDARCEFRLAKLLLAAGSRDRVQALAWCNLAANQGVAEARTLADNEQAGLSEADRDAVEKLRNTLLRAQQVNQ